MAIDLRRVAEASGVSVSTASRALAGSPRISAATSQRVRAAAEALGYRPNANARALRTSRSRLVGLVITNLINASFRTIAEVVQQRLSESGYQMVLSVTGGDLDQELAALHTLADHNAVGVIVVGSHSKFVGELRTADLPVVHLARRPGHPVGDCVIGDELAGAREATEYLIGLGHKRIGLISGSSDVTSGRERRDGYRLALDAHRIPYRDELVVTGPFVARTGELAVALLLDLPARARPTALFVANHEASFGALPALRERGVELPDELSVICYEDSELMRWWHPAVTVMENNATQMGELAATLLLDQIGGRGTASARRGEYRVGARLVVRGSCAAPRTTRRAGSSPSRVQVETQTS